MADRRTHEPGARWDRAEAAQEEREMDRLLTDERPIARQEYHCQASDWINGCGWADGDWTQDEAEAIEAAKKDGWKIHKGERSSQPTNGNYFRNLLK